MTTSAWIVLVLVSAAVTHSSEGSTVEKSPVSQNGTAYQSQQYRACAGATVDLRSVSSLDFSILRTTCRNSVYCDNLAAEVTSASCLNQNIFLQDPDWSCTAEFAGSGFVLSSEYSVDCPGYSWFSPCVLTSSCEFRYTPRLVSQPVVFVYSGVGGFLSLIVFCGIIYWCCCRRRRQNNAPAPIIIRTPAPQPAPRPTPNPAPARVSAAQTNFTLNFGAPPTMYPAQQQVAPAYVAPPYPPQAYAAAAYPAQGHAAPAHPAPAYAPPSSPPYNPNYVAPEPPKQGHFLG